MKAWITTIYAVSPKTGKLETFSGPPIYAETMEEADMICEMFFPYSNVLKEDVDQKDIIRKIFGHKENMLLC